MKQRYTRRQVEFEFQDNHFPRGRALCRFLFEKLPNHYKKWDQVWEGRDDYNVALIWEYFFLQGDQNELTYLTRALSLNMFLDDNNIE